MKALPAVRVKNECESEKRLAEALAMP